MSLDECSLVTSKDDYYSERAIIKIKMTNIDWVCYVGGQPEVTNMAGTGQSQKEYRPQTLLIKYNVFLF